MEKRILTIVLSPPKLNIIGINTSNPGLLNFSVGLQQHNNYVKFLELGQMKFILIGVL